MTAEEIRGQLEATVRLNQGKLPITDFNAMMLWLIYGTLMETTAQLAELNEALRSPFFAPGGGA